MSLGDMDGDGDLDAFVANWVEANRVWLNDGSGNFTVSANSLGSSYSTGASLGDVDGDGDLDAFVANYTQANRVWLNEPPDVTGPQVVDVVAGGSGWLGPFIDALDGGGTGAGKGLGFSLVGTHQLDALPWFGTNEPGQMGWDWLAIQLDTGEDLMLYRMRREDGSTDPFSSGSLVDQNGTVQHLSVDEYRMTSTRTWESEATGANYPLEWRIEIPSLDYVLDVRPAFDEQEMTTDETTGISYWEGAIEVSGKQGGVAVAGRGYMELTGYTGQGLGSVLE